MKPAQAQAKTDTKEGTSKEDHMQEFINIRQQISEASHQTRYLQILSKDPEERTQKDLLALEETLLKVKFGVSLPTEKRLECCKYMEYRRYTAGEILFKQGDYGEEFFIILSGSVQVSIKDDPLAQETVVAVLQEGDGFGELAFEKNQNIRRATVTCKDNSEFAVLKKCHYEKILQNQQQRIIQEKVSFLRRVPVFSELDTEVLRDLSHVMTKREYLPRQIIIKQEEELGDMYFIQKGTVKMIREIRKDFYVRPWVENPTLPGANGTIPPQYPWTVYEQEKKLRETLGSQAQSSNVANELKPQYGNGKAQISKDRQKLVLQSAQQKLSRAIKKAVASKTNLGTWQRTLQGAMEAHRLQKAKQITDEMIKAFQHQNKVEFPDRIFIEIATAGHHEYFAEQCVMKSATSQTTVISANTLTVYILNKWDMLKRMDKKALSFVLENSMGNIEEDQLKEQYINSLQWSSYKTSLVQQVIADRDRVKLLHPAYVWDGTYRNMQKQGKDKKKWVH